MSEEDPKAEAPTETENPESSEDKNEAEKESSRPPTAKSTQDEENKARESGGSAKTTKSGLSRQGSAKSTRSAKSAKSVAWSTAGSEKELIENEEGKQEKKKSLCSRIVAGMWASREMLKDNKDAQLFVKTTLRELFLYCIFLFVICYATFAPYSSVNYRYTDKVRSLFGNQEHVTNYKQFWKFIEDDLIEGLYWETWYNRGYKNEKELKCPDDTIANKPCQVPPADRNMMYENRILGLPRIRMLKVHDSSCVVEPSFEKAIRKCYASYEQEHEDKETTIPEFRKYSSEGAWTWQSEEDLEAAWHSGQVASYSGAGYAQTLHYLKNETEAMIQELKQGQWITQGTRFISVDFTIYNANINLFCVAKLVFEFPPVGGVLPSQQFTTVKLLKYNTQEDYLLLACEGIFIIYILYYIVEECLEIKIHGMAYFTNLGNILDLVVIGISLSQIAINVYSYFKVKSLLELLLAKPFLHADFSPLGTLYRNLTTLSAFNIFVAWIKIFKYLSFNKTMIQLSGTLSASTKDLSGFSVMFFIIYFAFVQLGFLLFGIQVYDFRSFTHSVYTLFRMVLGDFNFKAIESADTVLGPIFFLTYIFFVFFVLLNMFLAIINDTYADVKLEVMSRKSEFQVGDFFKTGLNNVKGYLGIIDRGVDVENAIKIAAADDGFVTYDELRENLRKSRFSDVEIDLFFHFFQNDPAISQIILDEDALKAKQLEEDERRLSKLSIRDEEVGLESDEEETGLQRPSTGKEARRQRSAKITADLENDAPVFDDDFYRLQERVDRMDSSISPLSQKIDIVLSRLDTVFKKRKLKKEDMEKIFEGIVDNSDADDLAKRKQIEELVKTWDSRPNSSK